MTQTIIATEPSPGVRLLTLNRPAVLNALDMVSTALLRAELSAAEAEPSIRAIVITGAGGRAFSAGFDIAEMQNFGPAEMSAAFLARDPLFRQVATLRKPMVAALTGITYGGGALLAAACDFRVASGNLRFRVTAASYGSANATWSLPALVGIARAKEILMTSRVVGGEEAYNIGLLNYLVDDAEVLERAIALAASIAANPPAGIEAVKALVNAGTGQSLEAGWRAEFAVMTEVMATAQFGGSDVFPNKPGK